MTVTTATELANNTGDILKSANTGPVFVKRHGTTRYVVLSVQDYEAMETKSKSKAS